MMTRVAAGLGLALLAGACAGGAAARQAEPVAFQVRGVVVDARTRERMPAVQVRLGERTARTDRTGAFEVRGTGMPGTYVLVVGSLGFEQARRRIRVRRAGAVDLGTLRLRPAVIRVDDLVVPECLRHQRPPADTAPGATVRAERDSAGAFWMVCRPPER